MGIVTTRIESILNILGYIFIEILDLDIVDQRVHIHVAESQSLRILLLHLIVVEIVHNFVHNIRT